MQYVIDVNKDLQKAKALFEVLKQRKCKDLMTSSLECCVRNGDRPSRFYKVYESKEKGLSYVSWLDNPYNLKILSLEDFIKQQGVITLWKYLM